MRSWKKRIVGGLGVGSLDGTVRELLRRTREAFFRNATALLQELFELARKDCTSKSRDPNSEHFFMYPQYFRDPLPPFDVLPEVLEQLAQSLSLLHVRIDEFREFTVRSFILRYRCCNKIDHIIGRRATFEVIVVNFGT